jgi:hypothetical protein
MSRIRFGATVLVAFAALTIGAAGAQAAVFTAAKYPAFISAEPTTVGAPTFTFESAQTAKCEFGGFGGEMTKASSELGLEPGFGGCTAFGAEGTVETNGCKFVLHPGTGSADKFTGTFDVTCPTGKKIVVKGNTCEVTIGAQTGLGPVAYEKVTTAEPKNVVATFQMKSTAGFAYTKVVDGASCPLSGTGAKTDGTVTGGIRIIAGDKSTLEPIAFGIE